MANERAINGLNEQMDPHRVNGLRVGPWVEAEDDEDDGHGEDRGREDSLEQPQTLTASDHRGSCLRTASGSSVLGLRLTTFPDVKIMIRISELRPKRNFCKKKTSR